ncbi:MAG: hypothetical protein AAB225_10720 [Acidobacteriota bacterium]
MAKFELTKTIEARKLNKRTGIPLGEPPLSIPFGAILENPAEDRDVVKFTYLGEPYQCPEEVFRVASAAIEAAPAAPKEPAAPVAAPPKLEWGKVRSSDFVVRRAKVPGGWLVAISPDALAFYPDPEHAWDGTSLP